MVDSISWSPGLYRQLFAMDTKNLWLKIVECIVHGIEIMRVSNGHTLFLFVRHLRFVFIANSLFHNI